VVLEVNVVDDHRCVSHSQRIGITVSAVVVSGRSVGIDISGVNDEIVVVWPIVGSVVEVSKKHHCLTCIANFAVDPLQQLNGLVVIGSILKCEDGKISREKMSAEDMSDSNGSVQSSIECSSDSDGRVLKVKDVGDIKRGC